MINVAETLYSSNAETRMGTNDMSSLLSDDKY